MQYRDPENHASASLACQLDLVAGSCSQSWLDSLTIEIQRAQLQGIYMVVISLQRSFGPLLWARSKGGTASVSGGTANCILALSDRHVTAVNAWGAHRRASFGCAELTAGTVSVHYQSSCTLPPAMIGKARQQATDTAQGRTAARMKYPLCRQSMSGRSKCQGTERLV